MNLTPAEQTWLDEYRQTLAKDYPGLVDDIIIYGSKARGDAGPDSDLDVLVVIGEADGQTRREVRHIGHLLSVLGDALPSIMTEWSERERDGSPFHRAVTRDGVHVA